MNLQSNDYKDFLVNLKQEIIQARNNALKSVNKELINLYSNIWEKLSDKMKNSKWGDNIIEQLSTDIKREFPWIQGFSKYNLWRMVKFFEFYSKNQKLAPLVQEISWSNNIIILEKCENDFQREYYLKLSKKLALSKRVLQNKIESSEFERILSENKTNNFTLTLEEEHSQWVENIIKEDYIFDFLSLWDEYKERQLEAELIKNLKDFILELWIWFAYIWNQYNLKLDWEDYFLDSHFYELQEHLAYFYFQSLLRNTNLEKLKIDRKTSIDLETKYPHLKLYAQNVLTYYLENNLKQIE